MLVTTFMLALSIKSIHLHHTNYHGQDKAQTSQQAEMGEDCYVCDFVMHKADTPKVATFVPVVTVTLLAQVVFTAQTVYRPVVSINSHSPPMA